MFSFVHIPKNGGTSIMPLCRTGKVKYYGHEISLRDSNLNNSIVIIREPISRVCSAIRFIIKKVSLLTATEMRRNLLHVENEFLDCWRTKDSRFPILLKALKLHTATQRIGKNKVEINWVFNRQSAWFFRPDNIILCEKMSEEFFLFTSKNGFPTTVGRLNTTAGQNSMTPYLSNENKAFIKEIYKSDFEIWNYWSQLQLQQRLDIDWSKHESFNNRT